MGYLVTAHSDVGIRKSTNQDSVLIQVAHTDAGDVALCVICDGMGGLAKGELASATLIQAFAQWFQNQLPILLQKGLTQMELNEQWKSLILAQGKKISDYGRYHGFNLGTTCVALLLLQNRYYIVNVGDSRAYQLNQSVVRLTKDQTFVQREIDMGRLTPEQAARHPQRNVLLQCVGASEYIEPDFYTGSVSTNDVFALCSDGFRHVITEDEMYQYMGPQAMLNEHNMLDNITYLTELDKYRQEEDNISVAVIKVC